MLLTTLTTDERIDLIRDAQEHIREAIDAIEAAIYDTRHEARADAYIVAQLKIIAGNGHGYVSRDANLDDLIDDLIDEMSEEAEDGEDEDEDWTIEANRNYNAIEAASLGMNRSGR